MLRQTALLLFLGSGVAIPQTDLTGEWMVRTFEWEKPSVSRLSLRVEGDKITGTFSGRTIEATLRGDRIEFKSGNATAKGTVEGNRISGEVERGERTFKWDAERLPPRAAQAKTHDFVPQEFHLYFSSAVKPVLRIQPGDTVRTWAVDAGGVDAAGKRRSAGGNPQTGPFYVEGALPGDTLAVRLDRVRLNRDWAGSGSTIMRNALDPWTLGDVKWEDNFPSRWKLDREKGIARLEKPTDRLKDFSAPLAPMLGCVGVAPPGESSIRTTDSGRFGGNMDYNQIREGTTLYLPVYHPGALLFVGDGHAAQGDGELTGDALETSMDIEFHVDVITGRSPGHPLAENADYLISIGIGGSLPEALQMATSGMMRWLNRDYKLTASESAMVLGFAIRYDVADLVGSQVSIAAKVPKEALKRLSQ